MAYLTKDQAKSRLHDLGYEGDFVITDADVEAASRELDRRGPWLGRFYDPDTWPAPAFPRSHERNGQESDGTVPEDIYNAAALIAYSYVTTDDQAEVKSESIGDYSVTFGSTRKAPLQRRVDAFLAPYKLRNVPIR